MQFSEGSQLLFVGEGDFSFVAALIQENWFTGVHIVATCLQEKLTERARKNTDILTDRGVEVILGVDATQLHCNLNIKDRKFTHIIFNFPHVGGKMRIDLNRKLLRQFFQSAAHVLLECGQVLVTLCAGQGGVPLDPIVRRWDDSWQVVLMASYAEFVLKDFKTFDALKYSGYSATGYRSLEKGFDQKGAFMYTFELQTILHEGNILDARATKVISVYADCNLKVPYFLYNKVKRKVFSNKSNMIGYLTHALRERVSTVITTHLGGDIVYGNDVHSRNFASLLNFCQCMKLKSTSICLHSAYKIDMTLGFKVDPLVILVCPGNSSIFENILAEEMSLEIRNVSKSFLPKVKRAVMKDFLEKHVSFSLHCAGDNDNSSLCTKSVYVINITSAANFYFEVDDNELWGVCQCVCVCNGVVLYTPCSLFPIEYSYDISFWEPPPSTDPAHSNVLVDLDCSPGSIGFDEAIIGVIIVNVARDTLRHYKLLSTYVHPKIKRRSYTYRITYRSVCGALSDVKAKAIHSEIGRKLEECIGVKIR